MLKWVMILVVFVAVAGCLSALGVGAKAMLELLMALSVVTATSLLIAWPFLRAPQGRKEKAPALQSGTKGPLPASITRL